MNTLASVDDLSHEWPPDVLHYDWHVVLGLTINDLLVIALPTMLLLPVLGIFGALAGMIGGFLAVKKFDALGERRVTEYAAAWVVHQFKDAGMPVKMPLIMDAGQGDVQITTWEGDELARIGGDAP